MDPCFIHLQPYNGPYLQLILKIKPQALRDKCHRRYCLSNQLTTSYHYHQQQALEPQIQVTIQRFFWIALSVAGTFVALSDLINPLLFQITQTGFPDLYCRKYDVPKESEQWLPRSWASRFCLVTVRFWCSLKTSSDCTLDHESTSLGCTYQSQHYL